LQDLEKTGAFIVSLDACRSSFRYHQLFGDLLQLELRRTEPGELPALHAAAAGWYAGLGYPYRGGPSRPGGGGLGLGRTPAVGPLGRS
jgi:LuxR family maltose regulon positive regulatory protein